MDTIVTRVTWEDRTRGGTILSFDHNREENTVLISAVAPCGTDWGVVAVVLDTQSANPILHLVHNELGLEAVGVIVRNCGGQPCVKFTQSS